MKQSKLVFTIFGGTGNLTYIKLMPAFYQLYIENKMVTPTSIVAIGRKEKTSENYRDEIKTSVAEHNKDFDEEKYQAFSQHVHYFQMDFSKGEIYASLYAYIDKLVGEGDKTTSRIFYFATAPSFFPFISEHLEASGLLETEGCTRAVFEKPFGYDQASAEAINATVSRIFTEENIYRIDHYLGKEMIQNINMVRFSNQIFSRVWNKEAIDNIQIMVKEKVDVGERGGYYDASGALRDMVQNHLLQILALVAMEPPRNFGTDAIRDEKVRVIKRLRINNNLADRELIFGQYEGYREAPKVESDSTTETFVAMKCFVDSSRWEGVPFYLKTGKALEEREAEVIIEFKTNECKKYFSDDVAPNLLIIKIQPTEGIYFRINTREPRSEKNLMSVSMDYCQSCNIFYRSPEAYEKLLMDIMIGDATLFTRWDEVKTAWQVISTLSVDAKEKAEYMTTYKKNATGPDEADALLEKDGRRWWTLEDLESDFMKG